MSNEEEEAKYDKKTGRATFSHNIHWGEVRSEYNPMTGKPLDRVPADIAHKHQDCIEEEDDEKWEYIDAIIAHRSKEENKTPTQLTEEQRVRLLKACNEWGAKRAENLAKELQDTVWYTDTEGNQYQVPISERANIATSGYIQVIEGSHRHTLHGLQQKLQYLRGQIEIAMPIDTTRISYADLQYALTILNHILKGVNNSIDAGEEITKLI